MIVVCSHPPLTYYDETFLQDVNEFLCYVVPLVLCVVLWKLFVAKRITRHADVTVLGLDKSASTYSPKSNDR